MNDKDNKKKRVDMEANVAEQLERVCRLFKHAGASGAESDRRRAYAERRHLVRMIAERTPPVLRQWTVILLRPPDVAATYGHDTFCAHVRAQLPSEALAAAREAAIQTDEQPDEYAKNYYCLSCTEGHHREYIDGAGGVDDTNA